jgi:rfaE bifunctional protein kinase chain/domain
MRHPIETKIKTRDEIAAAIGPRPRAKTAIMCHGVFDIVHPGHLRHLRYAKEKADLVITSITADEFITKGTYRPYVPEDLRAANLAALEFVDMVFIDRNQSSLESILKIQPDFFAKGYEYTDGGVHPRTQEEINALATYGGEMVFTPGDIVYSSTALGNLQAPSLGVEKLLALMKSEGIDFAMLRKALEQMRGIPVHIVGDTIVDDYSYCALLGASQKHASFSVQPERTERFVGAAAVVARHLQATGADVTFSTVVGDDAPGRFVQQEMENSGITCHAIVDPTRPTTCKERFIANDFRLLQVNRMDNRMISEKQVQALCGWLDSTHSGLVLFSDFRHGLFNRHTIGTLTSHIPAGAVRAADSQVSNRWGNILDFVDFDLITPNEREARFALADQDSVMRPLALELYKRARCKSLILKLGPRGTLTYRESGTQPRQFFVLDSFARNVVDPVGAGDALLAYASLALAATQNIVIATILGSMAAGTSCERQGNVPVTTAELEKTIRAVEKQVRYERLSDASQLKPRSQSQG